MKISLNSDDICHTYDNDWQAASEPDNPYFCRHMEHEWTGIDDLLVILGCRCIAFVTVLFCAPFLNLKMRVKVSK